MIRHDMIQKRLTSLQVFVSQQSGHSHFLQGAINLGYCDKVKKVAFAFYLCGPFRATTLEMCLLILHLFHQIAQTISILNLFMVFYNKGKSPVLSKL